MQSTGLLQPDLRIEGRTSFYQEGWPAGRAAGGRVLGESTPVQIDHLLRRAGFGADRETLNEYERLGVDGAIQRLLDYEKVDDPADLIAPPQFSLGLGGQVRNAVAELQQWWLKRMAASKRPLLEKMVYFWHGHLTSAISKVREPELMRRQNEFFRQNALASFDTILKGISRDGAMMVYLDNITNRKQHPNENYARELMELYTLGIGNYTEQDVKESARAFTGWTINRRTGEFTVDQRQHDTGPKTFLGQTGKFDGDGVVDAIVRHPAAGPYLARKLFSFLAYPNPDPEVVQPVSDAYYASGFSIKEMVRAILTSDAFFSERAYRARVKSPTEFILGIVRALGLRPDFNGVPGAMIGMGQVLFEPPSPAGWPGGPVWINTSTWMQRMNFLHLLVNVKPEDASSQPSLLQGMSGKPAEAFVDTLVGLLLDGNISKGSREALLSFAGGRLTPASARDVVYLVLGTPEYQLA